MSTFTGREPEPAPAAVRPAQIPKRPANRNGANWIMRCLLSLAILSLPLITFAQFNSGSTGADGALDLTSCPTTACEVILPESGVLNYTTVTISANKVAYFRRNSRNTPVIILAQGTVTIVGRIDLNGVALTPGPGGFYGGRESFTGAGTLGFGPGRGIWGNDTTRNGSWVGPLSLSPIVGGSGGAGGTQACGTSEHGGGGGGAIVIASSQSITVSRVTGRIDANGGSPGCVVNGTGAGGSGFGSGGAIRLVANTINMSGSLLATGVNNGVIRLEATTLNVTGTTSPLATAAPINSTIVPSALPQLTIASIGPSAVPSYAGTRFDLIDLLLPNSLVDPIPVVVNAQNIPTGTQVQVGFVSGSPNGTSTPCNLAGTFESSACTATISNLNRTGGTYLLATALFDPPAGLAKFNPKGPNQVAKVKLESFLGASPKYVFLRSSGTAIETTKLSKEFLKEFGM